MAQLLSTNITGTLTLNRQDSVASPEANNVTLFGRNISNRMLPAFEGPSGLDSALQPNFFRNKIGYWSSFGNVNTLPTAFGMAAPTATGTATARNVAATNYITRTRRLGFVSASTANSLCGYRAGVLQFTTGSSSETSGGGFFYVHRFVISDTLESTPPGTTMFIGLNTSTGAPANGAPNTVNSIGIGMAPGSNNFQLCYGGSAAQPRIDLGSDFRAANTSSSAIFELALFSPISASANVIIHYQVTKYNTTATYVTSGTFSSADTTKLPQPTTLLGLQNWRSNGASANVVAIDLITLYIETDY